MGAAPSLLSQQGDGRPRGRGPWMLSSAWPFGACLEEADSFAFTGWKLSVQVSGRLGMLGSCCELCPSLVTAPAPVSCCL